MSENMFCKIHKDTPTRLSCVTCGCLICPKCAVSATVGYKCPDCGKPEKTHVEIVSKKSFTLAIIAASLVGSFVGYFQMKFAAFGPFIAWAMAYFTGFIVARCITKVTGFKLNNSLPALAGTITFVSLACNPIIAMKLQQHAGTLSFSMISLIFLNLRNVISIISIVIGVWASVRHIRF